ncbi:MAG: hypothetical protein ACI8PT_003505 [Gammaproteobacteria bacterium]|jgi:hypothetical protein
MVWVRSRHSLREPLVEPNLTRGGAGRAARPILHRVVSGPVVVAEFARLRASLHVGGQSPRAVEGIGWYVRGV